MDKQQARDWIKKTFEQPFDKTRFTTFVQELLNHIEHAPFNYHGSYIPDAYRQYISSLERIGKFNDGENRIDILIIKLQKETSLASARTMQRNFVAGYLQGKYGSSNEKEAALVAYVAPDEVDWRFSLVKMDYKFEQAPTGKMKVEEELTPARRWSFLVGENEKSHTAQSRLVNILANDEHNPTLAELEEAFNIESVTKEFFYKYRDLFIRTKEALDELVQNNSNIKTDFEAKSVNTVDFAKKLLGQIVFLYFLQKKGWFGVGRDAAWGKGSKQFLRELFEKKHGGYNNFFNDILEPLFYEALRIGEERKQDDYYYSRFNCKIPFLNGGLFDPIGNYDWVHTDMLLPDSLFSNFIKTKEGDTGDGILDIFERYNFTVREDEPLEKEVAIDPELLGKAYEKFNAIRPDNFEEYKIALKSGKKGNESKFNKQYGVYYTPREIVHYMCQQSLINYLFTELNNDKISYEKLGDPNLEMFGNEGKKGQLDITIEHKEKFLIPKEDIEKFINLGEQVSENEAIALIKEQRINTGIQKSTEKKLQLPESIRTNAELIDQKLADITVCDPAVGSGAFPVGMMSEIVRSRNVLTTFIHSPESPLDKEGIKGGSRTPYDFKRQCIEHSLYGVDIDPGAVEIAKLRLWLSLVVDEEDIKNIKPLPNLDYKIVCGNSLLWYPYTPRGLEKIEKLKEQFFTETNPTRKNELRGQIDDAIYSLYKNTEKSLGYKVTMDFKINFSEVFHNKGGFDVIIANPPYIDSERMVGQGQLDFRKTIAKTFKLTKGNWDIYIAFFEKGFNLLNPKGILTYITPDKWISKPFGDALRKTKISNLLSILKAGRDIFEDAKVDAIVSLFTNMKQEYIFVYLYKNDIFLKDKILKKELISPYALDALFSNSFDLIQELDSAENKLFDNFICENACATSDAYKLKPLIHENKTDFLNPSTHFIIVNTGTIGKYYSKWGIQPMVYLGDKYLHPVVKRVDFFKNFKNAYSKKTLRPKIIIKGLNLLDAFLDDDGIAIPGKTTLVINNKNDSKGELKFLLALINSSMVFYYIKEKYSASSYNQGVSFTKEMINNIPFPKVETDIYKRIIVTIDCILSLTQSDDYIQTKVKQAQVKEYEKQIDQMVYQLYGLTEDEIKIVEGEK